VEEEMNTIKQDAVNYTGMAGQAKEDEWECSRQGRYRNQQIKRILFVLKHNKNGSQYLRSRQSNESFSDNYSGSKPTLISSIRCVWCPTYRVNIENNRPTGPVKANNLFCFY
jgi:hypothetical protein